LRYFCELVDNCVAQPLRTRFAAIAPTTVIEDATDQLPGHCFEQTSTGEHAGTPRLASYLGQSSLSTWLYANGLRLIQTALRRRTRDAADTCVAEAAAPVSGCDQPDARLIIDESYRQAMHWRLELISVLRETLRQMPARRRLASILCWVHGVQPAKIAEHMCVSRARISQLLTEAKDEFRTSARSCLQQIANDSSRRVEEIEDLMIAQLHSLLATDSARTAEATS
jgi:RNA polymerase sigma factor (sigma-70 family)